MYIKQMNVLFKRRYSRHFTHADRPHHPVTLHCRVTIGGIASGEFSTGQRLLPHHWNQTTQQATDECPGAAIINAELDKIRHRLSVVYNRYEYMEQAITAQEVVDELLGRNGREPRPIAEKVGRNTLADVLRRHLAHLKSRVVAGSQNQPHGIVIETYRAYNRLTSNISRYVAGSDAPGKLASHFDAVWMNGLLSYLRGRNLDGYYIAKHLYFVKTTLDWAVNEKIIRFNPVTHYPIDRSESDKEIVFLSDEELARLRQADFAAMPVYAPVSYTLTRVRDGFLAMVELGVHHRDYCQFVACPDKYLRMVKGHRFFRKRRQKTKQWALVPISAELSRLEAIYNGFAGMPAYSNKTFNVNLKMIAAACSIPKNLSTKAGRKTFADTNINEEGIDLDTVARMMGLSSTTYIKKYARVDERRILAKKGLTPIEKRE